MFFLWNISSLRLVTVVFAPEWPIHNIDIKIEISIAIDIDIKHEIDFVDLKGLAFHIQI